MERAKAIELLKNAVPARGYEVGPFIEAVCMAISALEGKDTNVPGNSALDHIHNVVAEREYQRGYEQGKADSTKWIPFTADTMPKEDGEYLIIYEDGYAEDYDLVGCVGIADFHGDCEAFGYWKDYYDPDSLGFVDSDFVEIKVKKWMPIPKEEGE